MNSQPKTILPVLVLKNTVMLPAITQVIRVGRGKSLKAIEEAEKNGFWILAIQQKIDLKKDFPESHDDLYKYGTLCTIESVKKQSSNNLQIVLKGVSKVEVQSYDFAKPFIEASYNDLFDISDKADSSLPVLLESLKELTPSVLSLIPGNFSAFIDLIKSVSDLNYLIDIIASNIEFDSTEKQKLLEIIKLKDRALYLLQLLKNLKDQLTVQSEIRNKLNKKIGENQRQGILREQLKAIQEELGENDEISITDKYKKQIEETELSEEVRKVALAELKKLTEINSQSPENHIIKNYLDLILTLPWSKSSESNDIDLELAKSVLEKDHFGLEKIKKRIVQHLAIMKLKKQTKGSILLFLGPPGVGKTSLGQSIAKALNRKFHRISLGGVRDEAEIRGHRRTYVGALPGRLIQAMKKMGQNDPVIMLDEIDKLSRSWGGDPSSSLLELLDPEQNHQFTDHYLELPFDFSKVFFIATANSLEGIPAPLKDRMEIIELSGYTAGEKLAIAKNHLIPKIFSENGIESEKLTIFDSAIISLINSYTREAGVRELQRKITELCRSASEKIVTNHFVEIKNTDLDDLIGPDIYQWQITESLNPPGTVVGLAWTPAGGDILHIEASQMPGKGQLILTGQLGDVMKESAQIALSVAKGILPRLNLKTDLSNLDMHLHVPQGSVPKDGPSAGITMTTTIVSLLLKKAITPQLAMTGEISLRGHVLPVGGIKEKLIAAHRAGVKTVLIPEKNKKDLKELPQEVKDTLSVVLVKNISEVLDHALGIQLDDNLENQTPFEDKTLSSSRSYTF